MKGENYAFCDQVWLIIETTSIGMFKHSTLHLLGIVPLHLYTILDCLLVVQYKNCLLKNLAVVYMHLKIVFISISSHVGSQIFYFIYLKGRETKLRYRDRDIYHQLVHFPNALDRPNPGA